MTIDFDTNTAAEKMIDDVIGYSKIDYTPEEMQQAVEEIDNALFHIKTLAQNELNADYWRTFVETLKNLYN